MSNKVSHRSAKKVGSTSRAKGRGMQRQSLLPNAIGRIENTKLNQPIRVHKREFIGNVGGSTTAADGSPLFKVVSNTNGLITSVASLAGNLGLTASFPWISDVAKFFEKYVFHNLSFEYLPSTGSSTQGTVALCPTYKPDETLGTMDKASLLNRPDSTRCAAWQACKVKMDKKKMNNVVKEHFVRTGDVPDKKLTDPYRMDFLLERAAGNDDTPVGELWVEYDATLDTPKGRQSYASGDVVDNYDVQIVGPVTSTTRKVNLLSDQFDLLGGSVDYTGDYVGMRIVPKTAGAYLISGYMYDNGGSGNVDSAFFVNSGHCEGGMQFVINSANTMVSFSGCVIFEFDDGTPADARPCFAWYVGAAQPTPYEFSVVMIATPVGIEMAKTLELNWAPITPTKLLKKCDYLLKKRSQGLPLEIKMLKERNAQRKEVCAETLH